MSRKHPSSIKEWFRRQNYFFIRFHLYVYATANDIFSNPSTLRKTTALASSVKPR